MIVKFLQLLHHIAADQENVLIVPLPAQNLLALIALTAIIQGLALIAADLVTAIMLVHIVVHAIPIVIAPLHILHIVADQDRATILLLFALPQLKIILSLPL